MINVLDSESLINSGRLYSTFLLWLLSELFEAMPEVGDLAKPKLVFFFDEAHLLFDMASKELLQKIADNDMDALRDLYEQVSAAVYTYALSIVQNPTTAEDVMQDAFVNIAQNAEKYVSQGKPMA